MLDPLIPEDVRNILEEYFGKDVVFKVNDEYVGMGIEESFNWYCWMTLTTLYENLKHGKRKDFIENFESSWEGYSSWLAGGAQALKENFYYLMEEGYYKTFASDIDTLANDTEFLKKLKEFFNSIPLIEEFDNFKNYQNLLKEFVKIEDDEIDSPDVADKIKVLEEARKKAFGKIEQIELVQNEKGDKELTIAKEFPTQMEMFTKIFQPLTNAEVDSNLDEILKEISKKLKLDYDKLKSFFRAKEETAKCDDDNVLKRKSIEEVIKNLPKIERNTPTLDESVKQLEQLLSELTLETSDETNVKESLREGYDGVKYASKSWENASPMEIHKWATSKKGNLGDREVYEAIAVMDRANELVTGGHRLRDAQILSLLTFLLQNDKGLLSEIKTGEGKTMIVSFLAAVKALQGQCVDIITSNPVLASDGVREKQDFYALLDLSVSTNNPDEGYRSGGRDCYRSNVVYGSISNFQFDYLKDSFLDLSTRNGRKFECIILDEVDSMIIDNASHIAKLSGPFPGMECLKYIYIKIWQELHKAVDKIINQFLEKLRKKSELVRSEELSELEVQAKYEEYLDELKCSIIPTITEHIKSTEPTKICILPSHIQQYADASLDRWISCAIEAKYTYCEDEQYIIRYANGERVIQPVDYSNTGITLKNTIWQYGLHQFLQLKHNLRLTYESLTSCFISNLGYINKYGHKIFGLTGTLGSEAEQKLLSSIYDVSYSKIPTFKRREFVEVGGKVVDDDDFCESIADDALSEVGSLRSSLVICETIKDAKRIEKVLRMKNGKVTVKTYFSEENADVTKDKIHPGEVVVATNIAGRGTDFRTSSELEDKGGLQVWVAFLPGNKRVEDQAFGRTARQGNKGLAKLVIKRSELEKLGLDCDNFEKIKAMRDEKEVSRISYIKKVKIIELNFQDEIFEKFSSLYRQLKKRVEKEFEYNFALEDLKEFWAFWLESKNFCGPELVDKKPGKEFEDFETKARDVINGEIKFNPYYSIQQAEHFILNDKLDKAEKALQHAIKISKNPDILHSAYIKRFEIAIERGNVFMDKIKKAVTDLFPIKMIEPDRKYKKKAKKYLKLAGEALKKEADYIESMMKDEDFTNIINEDSGDIDKGDLFHWYNDKDMNAVGEAILAPLGVNVNLHFKNRLTKDLIETFCRECQLKEQEPIFICYNVGGRTEEDGGIHWVGLCVVKIQDSIKVMYKDSKGVSNDGIADEFKKFHEKVDLVCHTGCEQNDDFSCGPMTLENLRIMAKKIKEIGSEKFIEIFPTLTFSQQRDVSNLRNEFANILPKVPSRIVDNLFIKHIVSKQQALSLNMGHTESLIQQIDKHKGGISVNSRISDYFSNLKPTNDTERNLKRVVANSELSELSAVGMNTTYALREVHDICREIVNAARIQIGGGIALIATGICFPPALPVLSSIGGTMIIEGLCDLATELMNQNGDGKLNKKAYIKGKVISYGISLLTLGISAMLQCPKILNAAKNACRWVSATLRKCPYLIDVCEYLAKNFDDLAVWFEKLETIAKVNQMKEAQKLAHVANLEETICLNVIEYIGKSLANTSSNTTYLKTIGSTMKEVAIGVKKGGGWTAVENVIMNKIVKAILEQFLANLKCLIKENVDKAVRNYIDKEKLKSHAYGDLQKIMKDINDSMDQEIINGFLRKEMLPRGMNCGNWQVQILSLVVDQCFSWDEIYSYTVDMCKKINAELAKSSKSPSNKINFEDLLKKLIEKLTEELYRKLLKTCKGLYSVGKSAYANY
ncbi:uncharacterized protein [Hetaerina americana]|uniref:uncharacterized protein n=1 Tax=Hetaerina americana TaxID=62018 RepID=UPI003A7F5F4A